MLCGDNFRHGGGARRKRHTRPADNASCDFAAGIAAAKLSKSRGMVCGAIAGALFFLLVWASGGIIGEAAFGAITAIKAGIMILAAAFGGIIGVNKQ